MTIFPLFHALPVHLAAFVPFRSAFCLLFLIPFNVCLPLDIDGTVLHLHIDPRKVLANHTQCRDNHTPRNSSTIMMLLYPVLGASGLRNAAIPIDAAYQKEAIVMTIPR